MKTEHLILGGILLYVFLKGKGVMAAPGVGQIIQQPGAPSAVDSGLMISAPTTPPLIRDILPGYQEERREALRQEQEEQEVVYRTPQETARKIIAGVTTKKLQPGGMFGSIISEGLLEVEE